MEERGVPLTRVLWGARVARGAGFIVLPVSPFSRGSGDVVVGGAVHAFLGREARSDGLPQPTGFCGALGLQAVDAGYPFQVGPHAATQPCGSVPVMVVVVKMGVVPVPDVRG